MWGMAMDVVLILIAVAVMAFLVLGLLNVALFLKLRSGIPQDPPRPPIV